ncbi:MAG: hypothetical protein WBP73_15605, partial [Terriglobales bacterium]
SLYPDFVVTWIVTGQLPRRGLLAWDNLRFAGRPERNACAIAGYHERPLDVLKTRRSHRAVA